MRTGRLTFNGIDATTGRPLLPDMTPRQLAERIRRQVLDEAHVAELRRWRELRSLDHLGPREGVDPQDLSAAGWAVLFPRDTRPDIREALAPLLDLRREQAGGGRRGLYRDLTGRDGYRPGETKQQFLARFGAGPGPADPRKLPYYILVVGGPDEIPYSFQYQLDVQYAVGRLCFEHPAEYASYAATVVRAETGKVRLDRRAVVFAPRNPDDPATALSHEDLAQPLARELASARGWTVESLLAAGATRRRLLDVLEQGSPPALLLTAGHGIQFSKDHPQQLAEQGGLVCQDWPGRKAAPGPVSRACYLAAQDVTDGARVGGMVAFHFACYSAGTPGESDFPPEDRAAKPVQLASRPFVARLAQRLLGHPGGGALAVIGHVDQAFEFSFRWPGAGAQVEVFASMLRRLAAGHPVGSAMEYFDQRYGELSTVLAEELRDLRLGKKPDAKQLAALWTAYHDARNYLVLGDPAVRLPLAPEALP